VEAIRLAAAANRKSGVEVGRVFGLVLISSQSLLHPISDTLAKAATIICFNFIVKSV
jgi:hypothetical protein